MLLLNICLICLVKYYYSKQLSQKDMSEIVFISSIKKDRTLTTQYLLSNVLPIISLEYDKYYMIIFTVFLLSGLYIMYLKNNLFYMNPIFDFCNINVYTADVCKIDRYTQEKGSISEMIIISNEKLYMPSYLCEVQTHKNICIVRRTEK